MSYSEFQAVPAAYSSLNFSLSQEFARASGAAFKKRILEVCEQKPEAKNDITLFETYDEMECWLSPEQCSGFAVTREGELVNVFSCVKGNGGTAVQFAQARYQSLFLNCLEGTMENYYARFGFESFRREENWFTTKENPKPDVVYMKWEKN